MKKVFFAICILMITLPAVTGAQVDDATVQNIRAELEVRLDGIADDINTEDGVSAYEIQLGISRAWPIIQEVLAKHLGLPFGGTPASDEPGVVEKTYDTVFCDAGDRQKGEIDSVTGQAFIVRGLQTYRAAPGAPLWGGDIVVVREDAAVELTLKDTGALKVSQKTRFQIPRAKSGCWHADVGSTIKTGVGSAWQWVKEKVQGEQFEIMTPTGGGGVRG